MKIVLLLLVKKRSEFFFYEKLIVCVLSVVRLPFILLSVALCLSLS